MKIILKYMVMGGSMFFFCKRLCIVACALFCFSHVVQADFHPHRTYKLRKKTSLNQGWKFYRNNPSGDPSTPDFNDASWATVNVPHSAMYVAPTIEAEQTTVPGGQWTGVCWYRKSFTIAQGSPLKKFFLEFEGAMQSAEVWVNGTRIGIHDACGYTGFTFDITSAANPAGANVVAVKLDCNYKWEIPPGNIESRGSWPDYFLYSGLYRDVWLITTGDIYIPSHGQKISTPQVSSSSATVRVRTTVRNDNAAAQNCTVQFVVVDADDRILVDESRTAAVGANSSVVFDQTTDPITSPKLWSPESPKLYRVFTQVSAQGGAVDDYVERFGIRKIDWSASGGFSLNGQRYLLKGVCMHQEYAWVCNALPNTRYFEEVKLVKDMGGNAIRCSHYPRDPSFYNACDELGVICQPELPSWGNFIDNYPAAFWDRMNRAAEEMVDVGYNHPSIILWGIFNEPMADFSSQFRQLHNTLKSLDSTRFTSIINNHVEQSQNRISDLLGLNYNLSTSLSTMKIYNAEYYEGWIKWCFRGDTNTANDASLNGSLSENRHATDRWSGSKNWTQIQSAYGNTGLAGGFMWCFIDYWSPFMDHPMGVLDHYRIPKKAYYTFRSNWRSGTADDYPVAGAAPTSIRLEADLTTLVADSTDLSRIIGSFRASDGRCVWSSQNINFQVTGPVDVFEGNPATRAAVAGKIGIVVKSRNTPGTATVTATSGSLTAGTVTLKIEAPDNAPLPFIWPTTNALNGRHTRTSAFDFAFSQGVGTIHIRVPGPVADIALITMEGKRIVCPVASTGSAMTLDTRKVGPGVYALIINKKMIKTLLLSR
ncbi:MAG: beta galactosidase jelly roll domain-containing protein [Chitinispirillaceae bacterium]|nr:beta galactosidase jelly roll domain-containing protein [Chitinispirillaceae bacterium]